MIALFITTTIIRVVFIIVMKKCCFTANRATGVFRHLFRRWSIRSKLVITFTAKVFLITISIFAIAIKRIFIIAFWTLNWYNFLHEDFILSGRYLFSGKNIVPQRIEVLNFHLSLQSVNIKGGKYETKKHTKVGNNRNNQCFDICVYSAFCFRCYPVYLMKQHRRMGTI